MQISESIEQLFLHLFTMDKMFLHLWNFDKHDQFYIDLEAGNGPKLAQSWFDTFDKIMNTIEFHHYSLEGKWTSTDDPKSELEFKEDKAINLYEGEIMGEGIFEHQGTMITVSEGEDIFEYEIKELNNNSLVMIFLDRGNILRYER